VVSIYLCGVVFEYTTAYGLKIFLIIPTVFNVNRTSFGSIPVDEMRVCNDEVCFFKFDVRSIVSTLWLGPIAGHVGHPDESFTFCM